MKLSREDFFEKLSNAGYDDEITVSLMEDLSDSWTDDIIEDRTKELEQLKKDLEDLDIKYKELLQKYKDRFLNVEVEEETKEDSEEESEEIIDVKEI